jgi:DNA-binding beta-propeller fold protein YncE
VELLAEGPASIAAATALLAGLPVLPTQNVLEVRLVCLCKYWQAERYTPPFTDLSYPNGLAVDSAGAVYVADSGNSRVLKLAAGDDSDRTTVHRRQRCRTSDR